MAVGNAAFQCAKLGWIPSAQCRVAAAEEVNLIRLKLSSQLSAAELALDD